MSEAVTPHCDQTMPIYQHPMRASSSLALLATLLIAASPHDSAGFVNLNFENAVVVQNDPFFGFLDWSLAVPGWGHSTGSDTSIVYYGDTHFGVSQWYLLQDRDYSGPSLNPLERQALADRYSLVLHSGYLNAMDGSGGWVQAFISQTDVIPSGTQSIRLLADGAFSVTLNGTLIPMTSLGGGLYAGDVSGLAGSSAELRITHTGAAGSYSTVRLDNVAFSTLPAPEPSRIILLGFAGGSLALSRKRRKARCGDRRPFSFELRRQT